MTQRVDAEELIDSGILDWPKPASSQPHPTDLSLERYCAHLVIKVFGQPPASGAAVIRVTERAQWYSLGGFGTAHHIAPPQGGTTSALDTTYLAALREGSQHTRLESSPGVTRHLVGIDSPYLGVLVLDITEGLSVSPGALSLLKHSTQFFLGGLPLGENSAGVRRFGGDTESFFSRRQHEVLRLVAEGKSNTEIGRKLSISASLAKLEVTFLMHALGARNRLDAVVQAQRSGLLPIAPPHAE
jgi:DNA-binding CsgD family transcriptional regulator